jgi:hypothetical protein
MPSCRFATMPSPVALTCGLELIQAALLEVIGIEDWRLHKPSKQPPLWTRKLREAPVLGSLPGHKADGSGLDVCERRNPSFFSSKIQPGGVENSTSAGGTSSTWCTAASILCTPWGWAR